MSFINKIYWFIPSLKSRLIILSHFLRKPLTVKKDIFPSPKSPYPQQFTKQCG